MDRAEFREERKLKLDYWKTVFSLGSVLAIGFATYQWYESNQKYRNDLDGRMTTLWREHIKFLIDKPDIGQYFIAKAEMPADSPVKASVLNTADLRLEIIDEILNNSDEWRQEEIMTWKTTFVRAFRNSSILCSRYIETKSNFDNIENDLSTKRLCGDLKPLAKAAKKEGNLSEFLKKWEVLNFGIDKICKEPFLAETEMSASSDKCEEE